MEAFPCFRLPSPLCAKIVVVSTLKLVMLVSWVPSQWAGDFEEVVVTNDGLR